MSNDPTDSGDDKQDSFEAVFGAPPPPSEPVAAPTEAAAPSSAPDETASPQPATVGAVAAPPVAPAASAGPVVPAPKKRGAFRELIETLLLAALIFFLVRSVILNFRVDGNSMLPNLHNGELVLVNHQAYSAWDLANVIDWIPGVDVSWVVAPFGEPVRGDIVIFSPPDDDKPYIKRVIGLPGDVISFADGNVYVNGQQLEEPYLQAGITRCPGGICEEPITVPEGHVFVLGDNRRNSEDSRYFGPITVDSVIGKAVIVYWPVSSLSTMPEPDYVFVPAS